MHRLPPDVPACHGLPAGAPCPTPEACQCQRQGADLNPHKWPLALALAGALGLLLALGLAALGADVNPACMTKAQAKAKWPKAWLYWHTAAHCWDNQRGGRHGPRQQHYAQAEDFKGKKSDRLKFVNQDDYNELDAQANGDTFFRAEPLQLWPPILEPRPKFIPWEERIGPP